MNKKLTKWQKDNDNIKNIFGSFICIIQNLKIEEWNLEFNL